MLNILRGIIIIVAVVVLAVALFAIFKLLAVALGAVLIIYLCWIGLRSIFMSEED